MDATAALSRALAEWRQLSDLEGEAILAGNWQGVAEHQAQKAQLQAEIQRALASIRADQSNQPGGARGMDAKFDSVAIELKALERRNGELIAAKRHHRQAESESLALTLHDLQGVRRAYGSSRGLHWQSYS